PGSSASAGGVPARARRRPGPCRTCRARARPRLLRSGEKPGQGARSPPGTRRRATHSGAGRGAHARTTEDRLPGRPGLMGCCAVVYLAGPDIPPPAVYTALAMPNEPTTISLAYSVDADDAFMFHALRHGRIDTEGLAFTHHRDHTAALNRLAAEGGAD